MPFVVPSLTRSHGCISTAYFSIARWLICICGLLFSLGAWGLRRIKFYMYGILWNRIWRASLPSLMRWAEACGGLSAYCYCMIRPIFGIKAKVFPPWSTQAHAQAIFMFLHTISYYLPPQSGYSNTLAAGRMLHLSFSRPERLPPHLALILIRPSDYFFM